MFEPTLADVLFGLFGPEWRQRAPAALGYSRRQVDRWVSGVAQPPRRVWVLLGRRTATAQSDIEVWARRQHAQIDETVQQRLAAASGTITALKLLGIRYERNPPRVGRPRKHPVRSAPAQTPYGPGAAQSSAGPKMLERNDFRGTHGRAYYW
jgi:hypothetical protein